MCRKQVRELGQEYKKEKQKQNILPTGKHFLAEYRAMTLSCSGRAREDRGLKEAMDAGCERAEL